MAYPPAVDELRQSLRYQVYPSGSAVLAWRYADWKVAGREGGTRGQPPGISRVLVGASRLLTPEVAIALYRGGLPDLAGPRPGRVTAGTELPTIIAAELSAAADTRANGLDEEASRQEGLRQVVAAALSDPDLPLAIYLGDSRVFKSPKSLHIPLLWGLRRIVSPVFGGGGRGWSFSTFEPPPGNVDPATPPGISFRQAQGPWPTGRAARQEIASRPFDPSRLDDEGIHAELAGWLVAEYQKRGGDELRRLVDNWCGTEPRPQARLRKVHDELRAGQGPPASPRIFMSYRRKEEDSWAARLLHDKLTTWLGSGQVFMDIDSIPGGDVFAETITNALGSCDVFLALIGSRWLTLAGQDGRRRLDAPGDFVRMEIEVALERGIRVIPILLDEAMMPTADQLPASIAELTRRQALPLSRDRFGSDFQRLRQAIDRTLEQARQEAGETAAAPDRDTGPTPVSQGQVPPPGRPKLAVSAMRINFGRLPLHSQSPERRVRIRNVGDGDLNWRAAPTASWLSTRQTANALMVTVDTSAAGMHDGTIDVNSDGGTATIGVRARIDPEPVESLPRPAFGRWLAIGIGSLAVAVLLAFPGVRTAAYRNIVGAAISIGTLGGRLHSGFQLAFTVDEPISQGVSVPGNEVKVKVLTKGSLALVTSGTLNSSQEFSTKVPAGQYQVCIQPPTGWTSTISTPQVLSGWICSATDVTKSQQPAPLFYLSPPGQLPAGRPR